MTFNDLIAPLSAPEFLHRYLGRDFMLTHAAPILAEELLSWDALNAIVSTIRVSGQRLIMVKGGEDISPSSYLQYPNARDGSRVRPTVVSRLLADGATLVLNQIDELVPQIGALAHSCEDVFRMPLGVNLYASWRAERGFNLHWDSHDALVIQIRGRKHWRVYRPTMMHPIDRDGSVPKPSEPPVWEGDLATGDILYMPRGWWHVACPINQVSVHLTIEVPHRTGADLVRWLAKDLQRHLEVRADIPYTGTPSEQAEFVASLRDRVHDALAGDVLDRFMGDLRTREPHRLRLRLPDDVERSPTNVEATTQITLLGASKLRLAAAADAEGMVRFRAGGSDWECDRRLAPALELLDAELPRDLQALVDVTPAEAVGTLKGILTALAYARVVAFGGGAKAAVNANGHLEAGLS